MKRFIKELILIVIGNAILAFAVSEFLLPNDVLSGGVAGVSILLKPFIPIDPEVTIAILSVTLYVVGSLALGKKFAITTLLSTIIYPGFIMLNSYFLPVVEVEPFLASIYGGLLGGVGIGIVIRQGASTGGMDIPPLIVNKYFGVDVSKSVIVVDGLTVFFGLAIYGLEKVLIGLFSVYMTSAAISRILTFGGKKAKSVQIISNEYAAISDAILKDLDRGTTLIKAQGGYTKAEKEVVLVVVANQEYPRLQALINQYDPNAFIIVQDAHEVHGEGFSFEARI